MPDWWVKDATGRVRLELPENPLDVLMGFDSVGGDWRDILNDVYISRSTESIAQGIGYVVVQLAALHTRLDRIEAELGVGDE